MALKPLVLESVDAHSFLQYVMDRHAGLATIVVCSSKAEFIESLQSFVTHQSSQEDITEASPRPQGFGIKAWNRPTLRKVASSRTVKLAFCPDVTHLRAYLATYSSKQARSSSETAHTARPSILAILNPIQLHRSTSAFSAQGLNRTFAVAVEAAHQTSSKLVITECPGHSPERSDDKESFEETDEAIEDSATTSPWDEEVSILNVTTKIFGAGERGWVGRTVKVRTIAARWGTFETLEQKVPP